LALNRTPGTVPASWRTGSETSTCPPPARAQTRAAPLIAAPNACPSRSTTSPACSPMRIRASVSPAMRSWTPVAHSTAARDDGNVAISSSPTASSSWPPCAASASRSTRRRASTISCAAASPTRFVRLVEPSMSVTITATIRASPKASFRGGASHRGRAPRHLSGARSCIAAHRFAVWRCKI